MELSSQNAEIYLSTLEDVSADTRQRKSQRIMAFITYCVNSEITNPSDSDIEKFIQSLEDGVKPETAKRYRTPVEEFLKWLNNNGGDNSMETQDNNVAEVGAQKEQDAPIEPIKQSEPAEAVEPKEKKKAGRPKRTNSENKTHKFSIYFPQSSYTDLSELCHFFGRSISEQMLKLAEVFIGDNQDKLDIFREAKDKAFNK
ncbi:MAG: hypothetical protein IJ520_08390 [Synergistaceae bacterium]|nr:hypothetical protein [Synergistaceae bacterium]